MPGYGSDPVDDALELLPWSWAEGELQASQNFWFVTLWPDGRPQATPIWGVWDDDDLFWFTCVVGARKALNIANDPRCTVTTEDARHPVVLNGEGEIRTSSEELAHVLELGNAKYGGNHGMDAMDPARTATIRVRPQRAFGLGAPI
jgi:Pyridoxamine 5'-phosphate oxidase